MNNLLNHLQGIFPEFKRIDLKEITWQDSTIGFNAVTRDDNNYVISGGTAQTKELAIRVAISEAFERLLVKKIYKNDIDRNTFLLNEFPSTSGFAAGFNKETTRFRAICEGLERWAWSKWIDNQFKIDQISEPASLTILSKYLLKEFNECYWFQKNFSLTIAENEVMDMVLVIFLGCTDLGIFPGSRVSTSIDNIFEHPIIEASRNMENFMRHQAEGIIIDNIIKERTIFYGLNKSIALEQIAKANKNNWPQPEITLLKEYNTNHPELFLYRCLMKDFIGWHEGDVTRFVY